MKHRTLSKSCAGIRYPIIIGTYGFQGKFITDAEWHSSFPAQTLAGEGYLVLLLNAPGSSQGFTGDSKTARQLEGWNKLETFEQAVDLSVILSEPSKYKNCKDSSRLKGLSSSSVIW